MTQPPSDRDDRNWDFSQVPANFCKGARFTWHQKRRHRAILQVLKSLKGSVLDYGCGYGDLTYAASKTHEACGTDLDPLRVAFAQSEYAPLQFQVCTLDDAPFPDASFDIVMSVVVLNFIPNGAAHLESVNRLLRSRGHLILACKDVPHVRNGLRSLLGRGPVSTNLSMRSREEARRMLGDAGFQVISQSYFFDPPFTTWKGIGDMLIGVVEQLLSAARVGSAAGYFVILAQKAE